jgi:hypothetical protein
MILTHEAIERGQSRFGGWSKQQVELLNVKWPLKQGWKKRVVGTVISDMDYDIFVNLKDQHLKKKYRVG